MKKNHKKQKRHYSANTLEFGLWGTVIGFIVAAAGKLLIKGKDTGKSIEDSAAAG